MKRIAIMISIHPSHVCDILNGRKIIELRKSMPDLKKLHGLPVDVYIYCTMPRENEKTCIFNPWSKKIFTDEFYIDEYEVNLAGRVVAMFSLWKIEKVYAEESDLDGTSLYNTDSLGQIHLQNESCVDYRQLNDYFKGKPGYAWYINRLQKVGSLLNPMKISDFIGLDEKPLKKAPQSWCYIYEEN